MTVELLIKMLQACEPKIIVRAKDIYGEGLFEVTGMEFNNKECILSGENHD